MGQNLEKRLHFSLRATPYGFTLVKHKSVFSVLVLLMETNLCQDAKYPVVQSAGFPIWFAYSKLTVLTLFCTDLCLYLR